MNRPIKFRAWDGKRSIMVGTDYPKNWADEKDEYWGDTTNIELSGIESICQSIRFALMQSTANFDVNGREIYEGDVVIDTYEAESNRTPMVITWDSGLCAFYTKPGFKHDPEDWQKTKYNEYLEVIGNVFENPELLNS